MGNRRPEAPVTGIPAVLPYTDRACKGSPHPIKQHFLIVGYDANIYSH